MLYGALVVTIDMLWHLINCCNITTIIIILCDAWPKAILDSNHLLHFIY